ncbi:ureidoglycolate lyase [Klebsiella sp. R445]
MYLNTIPLIEITAENIAPYGHLLGKPTSTPTLARGDIDYYHHVADSNDFTDHPVTSYLVSYPRPLVLEKIERHRQTEETFIPLTGESVMVLGKPGALREDELVAIHLDGSCGIQLHRDTWHFAPYALHGQATYLLLSGKDSGPDIDVLDVCKREIEQPASKEAVA